MKFWSAGALPALFIIVATCAIDQASKLWLLFVYDIAIHQPVALTPFMDVVLVWNQGVSYGLLPLGNAAGQWLLAAVQLLISLGLWVWLNKTARRTTRLALAIIIGGAIGNAIDRIAYHSVADFFLLHLRGFGSDLNWYVFNLADVAIVAGVACLLYESLVLDGRRGK